MKLQFVSKSKELAKKFASHIKAERKLESSIIEKDGQFIVEYSVDMDFSVAAWMPKKKKKKAKSKCKKPVAKADMGMEPEEEEEEDDSVCMEDVCCMMNELANYLCREMQYQNNWLASEIAYVENALYKHVSTGHLPPINGADKMAKALDVLGIGGDYEVQKPVVYASNRFGSHAEVDISVK